MMTNENQDGWENEKLAKLKLKIFRGHVGGVESCCFLNGENLIVSGGSDKTLKIWDINDGLCKKTLFGHEGEVTCCRSSPDGRKITSTGFDKLLIVWDASTDQPILRAKHDGMAMSCDISYDGRFILSCSDLDNAVIVWDLRQEKSIKVMKYHTSTPLCVRFARKSYRFCSVAMDSTSVVVDMLDYRDNVDPHPVLRLGGHINVVSTCDFSEDERRLCTGAWDKCVNIWDINTGSYRGSGPVKLLKGHDGSVSSCRFSRNGDTIIASNYDTNIVMWDADNACPKFSLQGHTDWVTDCDFSDDSYGVISSSKDGTVRFWNILRSDELPVVLQNWKNIGLRVLSCQKCTKTFSVAHAQDAESIKYCVFCRLGAQAVE